MPYIVFYQNHPLKKFKEWLRSGGDENKNRVDVIEITDSTQQKYTDIDQIVASIPNKYLKCINGILEEYTQQEKDDQDAAEAAAIAQAEQDDMRINGPLYVDKREMVAAVIRSLALLIIDEINILRERDRDRATDVAASTSLADLKSRWAERSTLNDRTGTQAKDAMKEKLSDGTAD